MLLTTHRAGDDASSSGSRLAPLLHAIEQTAPAGSAAQRKQDAFRNLLTRLVSDIDVLSTEYMEGMVAKTKGRDDAHTRQLGKLPSLDLATRMTDEAWLSGQTAKYHSEVIRPRFEATERREARAREIVSLMGAAETLASRTADNAVPMEEVLFSEQVEALRQQQAEADQLQDRFVAAYQAGERRELLLAYGHAALTARERVNRSFVHLEGNVETGILDRAGPSDVAETMEASEFVSASSPEKLLDAVRQRAASVRRKHVIFVSLVRRAEGISRPTQRRVASLAKDDLAKRADATSLARTRAARSRKSTHLPSGSVEYAQIVRDGVSPRTLHGMAVFYCADPGVGDWQRGMISKITTVRGSQLEFTITLASRQQCRPIALPSPRVRFLPTTTGDVGSDGAAPAPLPEDNAATCFGLLEHTAQDHTPAAAVERCLTPADPQMAAVQERTVQEATRDPPTGDADKLQVDEEVRVATVTPGGDVMELPFVVVAIHPTRDDEEEGGQVTIRPIGAQTAATRRVSYAEVRRVGFLAQPLRRWGNEEVVRREDARRLRVPPVGVGLTQLTNFWLNTTTVNSIGFALSTASPHAPVLPMGLGEVSHVRNAPLGTPSPHSGHSHRSASPPAPNLWQVEGPETRRTRWATV